MNTIRRLLSPILSVLLEPLVCRIADRLLPSINALQVRLDEIERTLASPFLPAIIKNEARSIADLPLALLKDLPELTVVGYFADDVAPLLPGCIVSPAARWIGGCEIYEEIALPRNLLFLDEYYFQRGMQRLFSPLSLVGGSIVVATHFEYLPEKRCRTLLHQMGFMEVALVAIDATAGKVRTYAVTHAGPVTGHPISVDDMRPPMESLSPSVWLVARKVATIGAPVGFDGFGHA